MKKLIVVLLVLGLASLAQADIVRAGPDTFTGVSTDDVDLWTIYGAQNIAQVGSVSFDYTLATGTPYYYVAFVAESDDGLHIQMRADSAGWHVETNGASTNWDGFGSYSGSVSLSWGAGSITLTDGGDTDTRTYTQAATNPTTQMVLGGAWWNPADPEQYDGTISNLVVTPEPATMALLGLGGLSLLRRRRRA